MWRRTRLISITATDELLDAVVAAVRGLANFISLHGSQWGGPPGEPVNLCTSSNAPGAAAIRDGVRQAIFRFRERGLAVLFDGDSLYWPQRAPAEYVSQVLHRDGWRLSSGVRRHQGGRSVRAQAPGTCLPGR